MKNKSISLYVWMLLPVCLFSQGTDEDFESVYKAINTKKALLSLGSNLDSSYAANLKSVQETYQLLDDLYGYMNDEHRLNGKGQFNFAGTETKRSNLFKLGAGISIDQGVYPYELDFSTSVQTLLKDGIFEESVSDIDISFDFHPYVPSEKSRAARIERRIQALEAKLKTNPSREKKYRQDIDALREKLDEPINKNGLWLENYVIAKRYSDGYLGIDQRYEIGAGVIFSFYGGSLTRKGQNNMDEINRKPSYKMMGQDLLRCLTSCAPIHNVLQLTESDIVTLSDTRSRYMVSNYKQYSRLRASLLLGVYYELEETTISGTIPFNGKDTLITYGFASTNRLRAEIRPGFVWKPKDKYRLKFHPYIKFPLDRLKPVVTADGARDERLDYFVDLQASLDISVEKNFSISLGYRYLYDHAPNRIFFQQADGSQVLLVGEQRRSSFEVGLNFNF